MFHYLFTFVLLFFWVTPTWAQDPQPLPADAVETPATEDGDEEIGVVLESPESLIPAPEEEAVPTEKGAEEPKTTPETDDEAVQTALSLIDALKGGQWPLAVGLFLTLLVYLVNRFALKEAVGPKIVPWIAFGVGIAGATGMGLIVGTPIAEAIVAGILAGVAAIGGWEMLFKHIGASKDPAPTEEPPKSS